MEYVIKRLKEPTTWQGLIALVTAFGVALSPELAEGIVSLGVTIFAVVSIVLKERGSDDAK